MYSVKNVKSFEGCEGLGFNANLYRDNKKVALVIDSAYGGPYEYRWEDDGEKKVIITTKGYKEEVITYKGSPEEKLLQNYVNTLPDEETEFGTFRPDMDSIISKLVDDFENNKRFKKLSKTKTLFRLKGDKEGDWRVLPTPNMAKGLKDHYGKKLEEVFIP